MTSIELHTLSKAYLTSVLNIVSGLFSNIVLLRMIVDEVPRGDFGTYLIVFQTTAFLSMAQLGLDLAAVQQISVHLGKGEMNEAASVLHSLKWFNKIAVCAIATIGIVTAIVARFHSETLLLSLLIALSVGTQALHFMARPSVSALIASHFQPYVNLNSVIRSIFTTVLAIVLLYGGLGVLCIPIGELISTLIFVKCVCSFERRRVKWTSLKVRSAPLSRLLMYGGLAALGGIGWTVENASDVYIISMHSENGSLDVAEYSLWNRMPQMVFLLSSQLIVSAFPYLSRNRDRGDDKNYQFNRRIYYLVLGIAGLSSLGLSLWLPSVVHHWLDGAIDRVDGRLISGSAALMVSTRILGNFLGMRTLADGNAALSSSLNWIQACVKVVLSVVLFHEWGVAGLMMGSFVASLVSILAYAFMWSDIQKTDRIRIASSLLCLTFTFSLGCMLQPLVANWTMYATALGVLITIVLWLWVWRCILEVLKII